MVVRSQEGAGRKTGDSLKSSRSLAHLCPDGSLKASRSLAHLCFMERRHARKGN
jgi:hypothetical protein